MAISTDFYRVVTDAINDILEHGFDSQQRVDEWIARLAQVAKYSLIPMELLDQNLRKLLLAVFARTTRDDRLMRRHKGVSKYTIAQVQPRLRAELDRRIMASSQLIKLHREQAIAETLRRFAGWSTSIPAGGTEIESRAKVRKDVRKSIAGLPFVERRVIIDQGHKLSAAVNDIVATDGGAIAGIFHSHWKEAGYDYRPAHKARDGKIYLIRDSWAIREGLVKAAGHQYTDEITQPAEEPYCFPGDSRIPYADRVEVAYRRWYSGELTILVTSTGKTLRATPNHPVFTPNGLVAIGLLHEGDEIVEVAQNAPGGMIDDLMADDDGAVPTISEVFRTIKEAGDRRRVAGTTQQFHGDGSHGYVDVVYATRPLSFYRKCSDSESLDELRLAKPLFRRTTLRAFEHLRLAGAGISSRLMSGAHSMAMLFWRLVLSDQLVGFLPFSWLAAAIANMAPNDGAAYAVFAGERQHAPARLMFGAKQRSVKKYGSFLSDFWADIDAKSIESAPECPRLESENRRDFRDRFPFATQAVKVVKIEREGFTGHVYNLQTKDGWYLNGIIPVSNCRCYYEYLYSPGQLPPEMLTQKGRDKLAEVRKQMASFSGAMTHAA